MMATISTSSSNSAGRKTLGVRRRLPTHSAPILPRIAYTTSPLPTAATSRSSAKSSSALPSSSSSPSPYSSKSSAEPSSASISSSLDSVKDASAAVTSSFPHPSDGEDGGMEDDELIPSPPPVQRKRGRPPSHPSTALPKSNGSSTSSSTTSFLPPTTSPLLSSAPAPRRRPGRPSAPVGPTPPPPPPSHVPSRPTRGRPPRVRPDGGEEDEEATDEETINKERETEEDEDFIDPSHRHSGNEEEGAEEERMQVESPDSSPTPTRRHPLPPHPHSNGSLKKKQSPTDEEEGEMGKKKRGRPKGSVGQKKRDELLALNSQSEASPSVVKKKGGWPKGRSRKPKPLEEAPPTTQETVPPKAVRKAVPAKTEKAESTPPPPPPPTSSPAVTSAKREMGKSSGKKRGPEPQVDEDRLREINAVLVGIQQSGKPLTIDATRKILHLSPQLTALIKVEFEEKGVITEEGWKALVLRCRDDRRKAKMAQRSYGQQAFKADRWGREDSAESSKAKKKKKVAGDSDLAVDGWKYLHSGKKKRKTGEDGEDFDEKEFVAEDATQQRKRSLRRRQKINYNAQLEDDPLTIVDLTWYPTKASQPFRVRIDPIIPVILDVHSHLADTEVIGVLSEINPASLVAASSHITSLGSRVVGWYHSHPYFRNQPSMVDVENQRKYQEMFQGGGGDLGASPFIGGIITPYGHGEFRPLPSNVKWFFHNEGKSKGGGNGVGIGTDDFEGGGTPMELWTDVGEEEEKKNGPTIEGHGEVVQRLVQLCKEYGEYPTRVDFHEAWQVNEEKGGEEGREEEDSIGGSQSSPSGVNPKGRKRTADEVKGIRCKLDQFRASLTQHVELIERWDGKAKRNMVDRVIEAVSKWKVGHEGGREKRGGGRGRKAEQVKMEDEFATEDDLSSSAEEEEEAQNSNEEEGNGEEVKDGGSSEEF